MNRTTRVRRRRSGGFTLVELLVVLAVLTVAMGLGIPALQNLILRSKTEGYAREVAVLLQRSRLEAIRMNRTSAVYQDSANGQIVAFLDADRNFQYAPDPAEAFRATDYEIGRLPLPSNLSFGVVDGLTTVEAGGSEHPAAIFGPDGSAMARMPDDEDDVQTGFAFRILDLRQNHLEIRVEPLLTSKVEVLKEQNGQWIGGGDPMDDDHPPWKWN